VAVAASRNSYACRFAFCRKKTSLETDPITPKNIPRKKQLILQHYSQDAYARNVMPCAANDGG
jgi:hypothetical protein